MHKSKITENSHVELEWQILLNNIKELVWKLVIHRQCELENFHDEIILEKTIVEEST